MDSLDRAEQIRLQELRLIDSEVDDTLRQVDRILGSKKFERVQHKARDFLVFVVAMKLLGKADQIKEMTIAMAVFRETADFDPAENSKVRVAAADLRERLAEYNEGEGRHDPIQIVIPLATYVPEIRDRRIAVVVSTFENWHPKGDQGHLCTTISDDVAYLINREGPLRARRVTVLEMEASRSGYGLRGSLEYKGDDLRVNISLANLSTGRIVCWRSFEERRDNVFKLTREVADVLFRALQPEGKDSVPVASRKRST